MRVQSRCLLGDSEPDQALGVGQPGGALPGDPHVGSNVVTHQNAQLGRSPGLVSEACPFCASISFAQLEGYLAMCLSLCLARDCLPRLEVLSECQARVRGFGGWQTSGAGGGGTVESLCRLED